VPTVFPSASNLAGGVDRVFLFIVVLSALVLAGITATMIAFVVRYSRKRRPVAEQIEGNVWLEVAWTVIPTVLFLAMFYQGWIVWKGGRGGPGDAMAVKVTGRQFSWAFTYPAGKTTPALVLPLGRPVRLDVVSTDVVHGFFVPAFRVKVDAVPGRTNSTWVTPTLAGVFDVECTVICGPTHSYMLSKVHVVSAEAFDAWAASPTTEPPGEGGSAGTVAAKPPPADPAARGKALAEEKGCTGCHSDDGSELVGPTFKRLWGKRETLEGGKKVLVDERYVIESIKEPSEQIVKGYPDAMPSEPLTDAQIQDVIAWLKTLK
jgi:cytochrome c oxidase subunit 2